MKNIVKLTGCVTIVFFIVISSTALHAEQGLPRFYLDYAVVQHSLKNDVGNFDEFMKLAEIDSNSADFIAKFWWGKAKKECDEYLKSLVERYVKKITQETSKEEKEELKKLIKEDAVNCFYGVYYDHWDEINQMVLQKYKAALSEREKQISNKTD